MKKQAFYRDKLLKRLNELDRRLRLIDFELDEPLPKDWGERAVEREGDEVLEHLGQSGLVEVARIRSALERIRAGSYGVCLSCQGPISEERLDLVPDTPLCRHCAAASG